ncbi:MAG: mannonate dehydratase [Victivallales bacterium]
MKLGIAMKPAMWSDQHLKLARQLGCESVVAWVPFDEGDGIWHEEQFRALAVQAEKYGLKLEAIENFHPAHWDHIVLDEPGKEEQIKNICETIRNAGRAGIRFFGYNFSACGVQGYYTDYTNGNQDGRGLAATKSFDESKIPLEPQKNPAFWFNTEIARRGNSGVQPPCGEDEFWHRLCWFLERALPVAEAAGVKLCAHPDDPPVPYLRGIYRPLHSPDGLRKLLNLFPSPSNCLEFCQGTVSTMRGVDIYREIEEFAATGRIGYVHFRNTGGTLPRYSEVFIDEGYVNMPRALGLYRKYGYSGIFIPDHTPQVAAAMPWETGMAYALGYIRGLLQSQEGIN